MQAAPLWTNAQIGEALGVSESSVRRGLKAAGYQRYLVPLGDGFTLDKPLRIQAPCVVAADFHIPICNYELVNQMIQEARDKQITTLVIAGDFLNFDSLSQYDPKQQEAGLEREINEAVGVMRILLETFEDIYYIWGNHDARLHKALSYKLQFRHAMRLVFGEISSEALERIVFSNLDHCYVGSKGSPASWYVCHPASYSRVPLSQGRRLAAKHGCNVVTAHSHHCAIGPAENGRHIVVEAGGFFDAESTAYLQRSSTFPTWVPGYLILDERGKPTLRSPLYD